jgi:leucyl/phenylalanyl-tRNA--protein transferase
MEELRTLCRGRGVQTPGIDLHVGPALRQVCGIVETDGAEAVRTKLRDWVANAARAFPVEVRNAEGTLVGGLYGVAIGGLFAGESMFHRERDASKVALVALVDLLSDEYAKRRLVDTQWQTPHLATLGVVAIPRREYLRRLETALSLPLPAAWR